jgi:hypothetical protein
VQAREYTVLHASESIPAEAVRGVPDWEDPAWRDLPALAVDLPVGGHPSHAPRTLARLCWDAQCLHVMFRVEDRYVRAVVDRYQGPVSTDSCVELFFTPGTHVQDGYFNIEMNCGGTTLFRHQHGRGIRRREVTGEDGRLLEPAHTLPSRVDPEMSGPVTWLVSYRVPFDVLARYSPVQRPRAGAAWRANLYKCGDATSHPHWLAWSPVDVSPPDFHRPEFFGTLRFTA